MTNKTAEIKIITNRSCSPVTSGTANAKWYTQNRSTKTPAERLCRTEPELRACRRFPADYWTAMSRYGTIPGANELQAESPSDDFEGDEGEDGAGFGEFDRLPLGDLPELSHVLVACSTDPGLIKAPYKNHQAVNLRMLRRVLAQPAFERAAAAVDAADQTAPNHGRRLLHYLDCRASAATLAAEVGVCEDTMLKRLRHGVTALVEHYSAADSAPETKTPVQGDPRCGEWYSRTGPSLIGKPGPHWPPASAPRAVLTKGVTNVFTPGEAAALRRSQFIDAVSYLNNTLRFSDGRGWPADPAPVKGLKGSAIAHFAGIAGKGTWVGDIAQALRAVGLITTDARLTANELAMLLLGVLGASSVGTAVADTARLFMARSVDAAGARIGARCGDDLAGLIANGAPIGWLIVEPASGCVWINLAIAGQSFTSWYWTADASSDVADRRQTIIARYATPDWWQTAEAQNLDFANEPGRTLAPGQLLSEWARRASAA